MNGADVIIAWGSELRDGVAFLTVFDSQMRRTAELVEVGNDWLVFVGSREFSMKGQGCPDPLSFVEQFVSPIPRYNSLLDDEPLVEYVCGVTGARWQVFTVTD